MSKKDKTHDPITDVEVSRMWYRDYHGRMYSVIKYAHPYGMDDTKAEEAPIYVAMAGAQPELLGDALQELRRFRELQAHEDKRKESTIAELTDRLRTVEAQLGKRWWRRSR